MRLPFLFGAGLALMFSGPLQAELLAVVGGTLVDVRNYGRSDHDIPNAVVLIDGERIVRVGCASKVTVPSSARRIDAHGRFVVPGLIDGFGSLRSQGFANAHLYHGVTTVYQPDVSGKDTRRGAPLLTANPSPRLFAGYSIIGYPIEPGYGVSYGDLRRTGTRSTPDQLRAQVSAVKAAGGRGIWIGYGVWPDQMRVIVREARRLGLPTIGELGFSSYDDALRAGVSTFVHTSRYLADFAPPRVRQPYADKPFDRGTTRAMTAVQRAIAPEGKLVQAYGDKLARSRSSLLPTLALGVQGYTPWLAPNPWADPVGPLIDPRELHLPVDPATRLNERAGALSAEERRDTESYLENLHRIDAQLKARGARFLAASGTSAFRVLPGYGLHFELELLTRIGLTPREALAAATGNYALIYGWRDVGLIEPGRYADLLVLNADPRKSATATDDIAVLIVGGKPIDRSTLLAPAASRNASP